MQTFLARVIDELILVKKQNRFHKLKLILPSERAKWQLKKSIQDQLEAPFIFPHIETIHNYILSLSKLKLVDNYEAQLILCKKAEELNKDFVFENFYNQSSLIIKDFNNVESYMINPEKLFYELSNINEIENWSLNEDKLSDNQEKFIKNYKNLGDLFSIFKSTLIHQKKGISGMLYRDVAENHISYLENEKEIYFVGLNALSKSEEQIINYIVKEKKGGVFVDADDHYAKNEDHEAGYFFRKHFKKHNCTTVDYISKSEKKIINHSANTKSQQIEIINHIIKDHPKSKKFTVITMDESLSPNIFDSLIKHHKNVNFSSGLNINLFESTKFLKFILNHASDGKMKEKSINYQTFTEFLNFRLIKNNIKNISAVEKEFKKSKSFKISFSKIIWTTQPFETLVKQLYNLSSNQKKSSIDQLLNIIEHIGDIYKKDQKELAVLNIILKELKHIQILLEKHNIILSNQQLINTLYGKISLLKSPIIGNKDANIQILGLLESRAIDVENIIFVSCNEDFLPIREVENSNIPIDLKKYHGIPSRYEKEALFAYYFYRTLHYSKSIHLINVKGNSKGLQLSEPSRYIKQLDKELGAYGITLENKNYESKRDVKLNQIASDSSAKKSIENWMSNGVSPSSIMTFNTCSMDFYFKYVLKIKEDIKPQKFLSPSEWGTGIHQTLEKLYGNYELIDIKTVKKMMSDLENFMNHEFNLLFKDKRYLDGKNAILYYHYKKCISNYFQKEIINIKNNGTFKILALEEEITIEETILINNENKKLRLKGVIDRIDATSNGIRLIDYKSGLVKPQDLIISDFDQLNKKSKALQLLFYSLLFTKDRKHKDPVVGQIVSIKNTNQSILDLKINKQHKVNNENFELFEKWLKEKLQLICSDDMLFQHNNESKYCEWC